MNSGEKLQVIGAVIGGTALFTVIVASIYYLCQLLEQPGVMTMIESLLNK